MEECEKSKKQRNSYVQNTSFYMLKIYRGWTTGATYVRDVYIYPNNYPNRDFFFVIFFSET